MANVLKVVPAESTRSEEAFVDLKRRILELRMPPGHQFTEGDLAAELGVSKTTIREALSRLRQEALVDVVPRSGYRVSPVTLKDARELLQVRLLLEGEAAALAAGASISADDLRTLDELGEIPYDPSDKESIVRFLSANTIFHVTIARLSGNRRLAEMLRNVLEQLERVFHLGLAMSERAEEIVHEHKAVVEAIKLGDPEKAREAAVDQAHSSQAMVLNALLSSDAVQSTNIAAPIDIP